MYYRILFVFMLFSFLSVSIAKESEKNREILDCFEDINLDVEDGILILTHAHDESEYIEITKRSELFVNGQRIHLTRDQRDLVADYYDLTLGVIEYAKEIGLEGAKIGLIGTKVGMKAVVGVLKVVLSDYESEDLEKDLESEAEKLEDLAADLEDKAEDLEQMADTLQEIHEEMREEIPELGNLSWF